MDMGTERTEDMNPEPLEELAGVCPVCGSDCNEMDELIKAEREIERLRAHLGKLIGALQHVQYEAASLADAQVIALECLGPSALASGCEVVRGA